MKPKTTIVISLVIMLCIGITFIISAVVNKPLISLYGLLGGGLLLFALVMFDKDEYKKKK